MADRRTIRNRIDRLRDYLDERYPLFRRKKRYPGIDELVLTILSQATNDNNSRKAFKALKAKYPTWDRVASAPERSIINVIREGGLAGQKGPRIKAILRQVRDERGAYDIEHIKRMSLEEGIDYLTRFKGVGLKTASCVLTFSFGKPAFPVDTHILRISRRLGIAGRKDSADKTTRIYLENTDEKERYKLHLDIIRYGREVCKAQNPMCEICGLKRDCLFYKKNR